MKSVSKICVFLVTFTLVACATAKIPVATGGSKADALVEMSYDVGGFEQPVVDWDAAKASASKRCQAWGYRRADPFEGTKNVCTAYSGYGCVATRVTRTYQCLK